MTKIHPSEAPIADGMSPLERFVKRLFDVLAAAIGLVLLSPLFLYVAVKIKLHERGDVLYRQERIGYKGKPFYILKFRTMKEDSEADGIPKLYPEDSDNITPTGKALRQHHLDELPQLINILLGDMSFVGPRPERKYFIEQIMARDPRYKLLYDIRPGATSMATIYNGYTDTMEKMLRRLQMDLDYMQHRSLRLDLKILWLTGKSLLAGKHI